MSKPNILIVEADILVRHPLAEFLRECGYRVLEAVDAGEARTVLDDDATPIDVMLVDVGDGAGANFELTRWVRANRPGTRLLLAGTIATATREAGELCAERPEIAKPYDHRQVHDQIRRLLAARDRQKQQDRATGAES